MANSQDASPKNQKSHLEGSREWIPAVDYLLQKKKRHQKLPLAMHLVGWCVREMGHRGYKEQIYGEASSFPGDESNYKVSWRCTIHRYDQATNRLARYSYLFINTNAFVFAFGVVDKFSLDDSLATLCRAWPVDNGPQNERKSVLLTVFHSHQPTIYQLNAHRSRPVNQSAHIKFRSRFAMCPLKVKDVQDDILAKKPVLLLDTNKLAIRYLIRHVLANNLPHKLPTELWLNIVSFYAKICEPIFKAVRPTSISAMANGQMLHCVGIDLDLGELEGKYAVMAAEDFLPSSHPLKDQNVPRATETEVTNDIAFSSDSISSGTMSTPGLCVPDCLFTAITVPDVISWLHDGSCWVCRGKRTICPGCTGGKSEDFGAFMGCGVDLACPLCMGLDFMLEDKEYLEYYYYEEPPAEEAAARKARIDCRMIELDYLEV